MRKQHLTLLMLIPLLCGCSKTNELYVDHAYNSSNFMENYYKEHNGVDEKVIANKENYKMSNGLGYTSTNSLSGILPEDNPDNYPWSSLEYSQEFGRHYNLSKIDESFAYGYLSKLYDGRVRCEGKYQLSRVQIDRHGYATFFPKKLVDYKYFAFSLRGATDYDNSKTVSPLKGNVHVDIHISFYKHITNSSEYNVVNFDLMNVEIPCDNGGDTNLVSIYLAEDIDIDGVPHRIHNYDLSDTVAMSMTFELRESRDDLSDDASIEKDHHFALMLYEVMFPKSVWR